MVIAFMSIRNEETNCMNRTFDSFVTKARLNMVMNEHDSFLDTAPCSVVEVDQGFRDAYCLHHRHDESSRHL
jgi:hypothetical protein